MESNNVFRREHDSIENDVLIFNSTKFHEFEHQYLGVREKEQRILSDKEVSRLPEVSVDNIHRGEWLIRKHSTERLLDYLQAEANETLRVLDLGCGNGWFAHLASQLPGCSVIALDVNLHELTQGRRVFQQNNIQFCYGDINSALFQKESFDYIVMNCMVQYFPNLQFTMETCLALLSEFGELHIVDSPFYSDPALAEASKRSLDYYTSQGHAEMGNHYFHHPYSEIETYSPLFHYDPRLPGARDQHKYASPFPWLSIRKPDSRG